MSDNEEWGEWQEHDGKGCPCRGMMVQSEERSGLIQTHIAGGIGNGLARQWDWSSHFPKTHQIIRYRIRKPRALLQLIEMVENRPAPQGVDA